MVRQAFGERFAKVAARVMTALDCPRSLTVHILLQYGEFQQLAELKCSPAAYCDASAYARASAATDFLRKNADLPTGLDTERNCLDAFREAERKNCETNARLWPYLFGVIPAGQWPLREFLARCKNKIGSWLGPVPRSLDCRPSSGAVVELKGMQVNLMHKLTSKPTITENASSLISFWYESLWGRSYAASVYRNAPDVVRGDHFFTVPKDATTDRSCGKGPGINVALQLAVGRRFRSSLKRIGIDLERGQSIHSRMAYDASLTGEEATVDLRNASNRIAKLLVKGVFPDEWYEVLDSLRSHYIHFNGKHALSMPSLKARGKQPSGWSRYEMFAPMGNGFTFEMETLIFLAVVAVVCDIKGIPYVIGDNLSVYGDDIVCPTGAVDTLRKVFSFLGLEVNEAKSFSTGSFRESCGSDFWLGEPVRPVYTYKEPSSPLEWMDLHNKLFRLESRFALRGERLDLGLAKFSCVGAVPKDVRFFGPPGLDGTFFSYTRKTSRVRNQVEWFRVLRPVVQTLGLNRFGVTPTQCAAYLLLGGEGWNGKTPLRGEPIGYKKGRAVAYGLTTVGAAGSVRSVWFRMSGSYCCISSKRVVAV